MRDGVSSAAAVAAVPRFDTGRRYPKGGGGDRAPWSVLLPAMRANG